MKKLFLVLTVLMFAVFSANAQMSNKGKFNVWSMSAFERDNSGVELTDSEAIYFSEARAGKQAGFERVTFEFKGAIPSYSIKYVNTFNATGEEPVKIAGKSFIDIVFRSLPPDEEGTKTLENYPKGKLKLKLLQEVKLYEYFEGDCNFALGLSGKRAFRVTELQNPNRVVVDFK
jgi:hypothetical protein